MSDRELECGTLVRVTTTLSADTSQRLIALRALLEQAGSEAKHQSQYRQAAGVILLDGAVELGTYEAGASLGLSPERDFDKQINRVLSTSVTLKNGMKEVSRLRSARNKLQHEGLQVHPKDLPVFVLAAQRFVDELVTAVFGVSIWSVSLADAIAAPNLRKLYEDAVTESETGTPRQAVKAMYALYWEVGSRLRGFGASAREFRLKPWGAPDSEWTKYLDDVVSDVDELVLMSTATSDTTELLWFQNLLREQEHANAEDLPRALAFLFWLVVGFESSPAALRRDRQEEWEKQQRRERAGNEPARVASVSAGVNGRGKLEYEITLDNVPDLNDWDVWSGAVTALLAELGGRLDVRPRIDSIGRLVGELGRESDFAVFRTEVNSALTAGEDAIAKRREQLQSGGEERALRQAEFQAEYAAYQALLPDWVESAKLRWDDVGGVREGVRFQLSPEIDRLAADLAKHMHGYDDVEQFWQPWTLQPVLPVTTIAAYFRAFDARVQALRTEDAVKERASLEALENFAAAFDDRAGQDGDALTVTGS